MTTSILARSVESALARACAHSCECCGATRVATETRSSFSPLSSSRAARCSAARAREAATRVCARVALARLHEFAPTLLAACEHAPQRLVSRALERGRELGIAAKAERHVAALAARHWRVVERALAAKCRVALAAADGATRAQRGVARPNEHVAAPLACRRHHLDSVVARARAQVEKVPAAYATRRELARAERIAVCHFSENNSHAPKIDKTESVPRPNFQFKFASLISQ